MAFCSAPSQVFQHWQGCSLRHYEAEPFDRRFELILLDTEQNGDRLFLIADADSENGYRREIIGIADNEHRAPEGSLHVESQTVGGDVQSYAHRELVTKQQANLFAGKERTSSQ